MALVSSAHAEKRQKNAIKNEGEKREEKSFSFFGKFVF
jgi:hypothetical protein